MFVCSICQKSYKERSQLYSHSRLKHNSISQAPHMKKKFERKSSSSRKRKRSSSSSSSDSLNCKDCGRSLERCMCSSHTGVYSFEPYIRKKKKRKGARKLSQKQFNTAFYQNLATRPLHSFSNPQRNVNGYLRSSQIGAHYNFQSVPLINGVDKGMSLGQDIIKVSTQVYIFHMKE